MKSDISIKLGLRLRDLRMQHGLSQEELAYKAGVHRTYIGMVERAEKNVTITSLNKIAEALNTDIKNLLTWD
ncbi:MAG TPA: helix-turn-helix transcriptional regulator [Chitinophagales bacterium]|nr:helix-turn-helix transcriptional regulator [Chitinophagales bacterium]HRK25749.1 helix-turn-helix transcriptional regulator [Chitinophagales bacterium]